MFNGVHGCGKFWKIQHCEFGQDLGSFSAGTLANQISNRYMDEAIETVVTINDREELNFQIFKQTALEKNLGVCDRPDKRNALIK